MITKARRTVKSAFLQAEGNEAVRRIAWLQPPLDKSLAASLLQAPQDFLVLLDAADLHVEALLHGEDRLFSFYSEVAALAGGRQMILSLPWSGRVPPPAHLQHAFLSAALRTSAFGRVALLLAFADTPDTIRDARTALDATMRELFWRDLPFDEVVPVGLRLETPAAVLNAHALAEEVDFLDLELDHVTQLALGGSPTAPMLKQHRQEILQLAKLALSGAHAAARFLSVSGSLASDPYFRVALADLGVDAITEAPFC